MIDEAIILAGGFGTRMAHVLGNVPKPMAPVYGKPFITYVLDKLQLAGIKRVILATGYMHEVVQDYFGSRYKNIEIVYSQECQPLFTGGAIVQASQLIIGDAFFVLNGDTLFDVDFNLLADFSQSVASPVSVALRAVDDTSRYGAVKLNGDKITSFVEKTDSSGSGVINGGIYVIDKKWLQQQSFPTKFSFEKEVLQTYTLLSPIFSGLVFDKYFIDIGVPQDYFKAQKDFVHIQADKFCFLDRDGVLNEQIIGDYVRSWQQWRWISGVRESFVKLSSLYDRIFIVSNQQGVGKGLFTQADLDQINGNMLAEIGVYGGHIDKIYVCTDLENAHSINRKPAIGMAIQAKTDFPEVDFSYSIMLGDSLSDMQFGYNAGMRCVYLTKNNPIPDKVRDYTDLFANDLSDFTERYCNR